MTHPRFLVSVGEYSGELLGVQLLAPLKKQFPEAEFFGIWGASKAVSVFKIQDYRDLNINGVFDILKHLPVLNETLLKLLNACDQKPVHGAILIDYPGFHFSLAPHLKIRQIPIIQFVAPKVWAWGKKRIPLLRTHFDLVMGIFPFEIEFFARYRVPYVYVGCPLVNRAHDVEESSTLKKIHAVGILPGSRPSEIRHLLPIFCDTMEHYLKIHPDAYFAIPVASEQICTLIKSLIPTFLMKKILFFDGQKSLSVMKSVKVCLVASGTATLECALLETPMVVAYRMDAFSFAIVSRKIQIPWISLVNIIMNKEIVKEHIQDIDSKKLATELANLAQDSQERTRMIYSLNELKDLLGVFDPHIALKHIQKICGL